MRLQLKDAMKPSTGVCLTDPSQDEKDVRVKWTEMLDSEHPGFFVLHKQASAGSSHDLNEPQETSMQEELQEEDEEANLAASDTATSANCECPSCRRWASSWMPLQIRRSTSRTILYRRFFELGHLRRRSGSSEMWWADRWLKKSVR